MHDFRPCQAGGATEVSLTQLPWNPNGTRCGRWMRATSGPVMSSASRMHSSLESVVASYTTDRIQPASSAGAVGLGDEDRFGAAAAPSVLVGLGGSRFDVDLDRRPVQVDPVGDDLGRVAVAVLLEADPRVVSRELLGPVVDAGLADSLGDRVDDPSVEGRRASHRTGRGGRTPSSCRSGRRRRRRCRRPRRRRSAGGTRSTGRRRTR